jgi:hypothetical protein
MAKGPDYIGKWLKLLEKKNKKLRRAVLHLIAVIPTTDVLPDPVVCQFDVVENGKQYQCKAKLTPAQCQRLQEVAPDYMRVRKTLETLVSDINTLVQQCLAHLEIFFHDLAKRPRISPGTGACKYDTGGCALNQSPTDCTYAIGGSFMGPGTTDCLGIPPGNPSTKKRPGKK